MKDLSVKVVNVVLKFTTVTFVDVGDAEDFVKDMDATQYIWMESAVTPETYDKLVQWEKDQCLK